MYFVELFAGAGGMGLGLDVAGMEHLLSFEWAEAQHSVLMHAGKDAVRMDLIAAARLARISRERESAKKPNAPGSLSISHR